VNYPRVRKKLFVTTLATSAAAAVFAIAGHETPAWVLTGIVAVQLALDMAMANVQKRKQNPRKSYAVAINGQRLTRALTLLEASSLAASLCADDFLKLRSKAMLPQIFEVVLL
jgi:hypothetical protein